MPRLEPGPAPGSAGVQQWFPQATIIKPTWDPGCCPCLYALNQYTLTTSTITITVIVTASTYKAPSTPGFGSHPTLGGGWEVGVQGCFAVSTTATGHCPGSGMPQLHMASVSPHSPGVGKASFPAKTEPALGRRRILLPMGEGNRVIETRGSRISPPLQGKRGRYPTPGTCRGFPRAPTPPPTRVPLGPPGPPILTPRQPSSLRPLSLLLLARPRPSRLRCFLPAFRRSPHSQLGRFCRAQYTSSPAGPSLLPSPAPPLLLHGPQGTTQAASSLPRAYSGS